MMVAGLWLLLDPGLFIVYFISVQRLRSSRPGPRAGMPAGRRMAPRARARRGRERRARSYTLSRCHFFARTVIFGSASLHRVRSWAPST